MSGSETPALSVVAVILTSLPVPPSPHSQVNSNISDKNNDLRQVREQIRRLDERLELDMQVWYKYTGVL